MMEQGILAFTLANVVGALIWGYGIRKFGLGRNIARFLFLNLLVATACTFVAISLFALLHARAKVSAEYAPLVVHLSAAEAEAVSALRPPSWAASEMLRGS